MKNGKNPTVKESRYIKSCGLEAQNWLISKKTSEEWVLVHRETGFTRKLPAP